MEIFWNFIFFKQLATLYIRETLGFLNVYLVERLASNVFVSADWLRSMNFKRTHRTQQQQ